ncbi:type I 3-dehydroquinate dehydratase [Halohasta salina]|uniref:type I 3-dehydroquinate dehydratase n=1 Tax=Halohasta salina TaxID=2961621 RepID=UPI0020A3BA90|nr:type I 3-dehydroquinate dehydratase [Halohasta salina]
MSTLDFDAFVLAAANDDLSAEPAAREHADAVEFRMDMATDPLDQLAAYDGELPLIVTNRATWEGGEADDESQRLDTLEAALDHEAVAAVDLECGALDGTVAAADTERVRSLRDVARKANIAVIASIHDFESTPSVDGLVDLLERASDEGDVGKLAVTATDRSDALAVLTATHRAVESGWTVATMAMGSAGQHTRAVAPVYGSAIGYAPVDPAGATAPGQYELATLRRLVDDLSADR